MLLKRNGARGSSIFSTWRRRKDVGVQAEAEDVNEQKEAESPAVNDIVDILVPTDEDARIVFEALNIDSIISRCAEKNYSAASNDVRTERDLQTPTTCPSIRSKDTARSIETAFHEQHWFDAIIEPQIVSRDNSIYNYSTQSYEEDGSTVRNDSFSTGYFPGPAWSRSSYGQEIDHDDVTLASVAKEECTVMSQDEPVPADVVETPPTELLCSEEHFANQDGNTDDDHDIAMKSSPLQVDTLEDVLLTPSEDVAALPPDETKSITTSHEEKSSEKRRSSMFSASIGKWFFLKKGRKYKDNNDQFDHNMGGFALPPEVGIDSVHFLEETSIVPSTQPQGTPEDVPVDLDQACSENEKSECVENHELSSEKSASAVVEAEQEEDPEIDLDEETSDTNISSSSLQASSIESPSLKVIKSKIRFWKRKGRDAATLLKPIEEEESVFTEATSSTAGWDKEISRHNIITVTTTPPKKEGLPEKKTKRWKKKLGFWRKDKQVLDEIAESNQDHRVQRESGDSSWWFMEMLCGPCYGCDGNSVACNDISLNEHDNDSQF
jgi:hypothetical protein